MMSNAALYHAGNTKCRVVNVFLPMPIDLLHTHARVRMEAFPYSSMIHVVVSSR